MDVAVIAVTEAVELGGGGGDSGGIVVVLVMYVVATAVTVVAMVMEVVVVVMEVERGHGRADGRVDAAWVNNRWVIRQ